MIFALDVLSVKDSPHCFDVLPRFHDKKVFAGRLNIAPETIISVECSGVSDSPISSKEHRGPRGKGYIRIPDVKGIPISASRDYGFFNRKELSIFLCGIE